MKRRNLILPATVAMSVALISSAAFAAQPQRDNFQSFNAERVGSGDSYVHPLGKKQNALKQKALEAKVMGLASGKVHEVAKGQYVELEREGEDLIWTVLAEFGDDPFYDPPGLPGPLHNEIPAPDRTPNNNNSTIWVEDFNQAYYEETLFADSSDAISMRNFYKEVSSNRYVVDGEVTDWGKVLNNHASYGRYSSDAWFFVMESLDDWYETKLIEGWTADDFDDFLSKYDVWDRYDYDGDGDFNEPDGYIDHFQSVHAGEGNEAGGGAYGDDAIWSHRWYAFYNGIGIWGPGFNPAGGVPIGDTGYWVGDYTIEPENGGVGVFAHEFGHDLDLPDLYNTGNGTDNSVSYWSLMSAGSWTSQDPDNIGSAPTHMGAWEKFQLGWLNYEVAFAGQKSEHKLGPAEANTKQAQALFVVLPQKYEEVTVGVPFEGDYFYFSGSGNDLDNFMYRTFTLAPGSSLSAKANVQIEVDWDYAYLIVSDDGGATWTNVNTNLSTNTDPNGQNFGEGITGDSHGYVDLTADLSAFVGDVLIGFRYWT
ncbi:MAG: M6 family metalloprotease domain-containing protein, partial [Nitrospirales bacterium]